MKTILILMDTLRRDMLRVYRPQAPAKTPNIDRLAAKSLIFDRHFIGSAPCMPARRDILTGRLHFLERGWGPIEAFDVTLPQLLREKGVFSHIVTDHYHYARVGGEGYMAQYDTWDLIRGQEIDGWASQVKDPEMPPHWLGRVDRQYQCNRQRFDSDADYPTPKTFAAAIQWLRENEGADQYFLQVEAVDPHEPFDAPEAFKAMYPDDFDTLYEWPQYGALAAQQTPEAAAHLQNLYCATLSMADKWLGKLLDEMDRQNLWEDTLVIFTSDHGHMLGEHGVTGKNLFHAWNEMAQIPLFIHLPGGKRAGERVAAVTQNIDLMPTLLEYYGAGEFPVDMPPLHGRSLMPVIENRQEKVRDYALYGWFGKPVNITDGRYTYFRAAKDPSNAPLYAYMSMPTTIGQYFGRGLPAGVLEAGDYLPWAGMPVYRLDMAALETLEGKDASRQELEQALGLTESLLFDIQEDPGQHCPINDPALEQRMSDALIEAMKDCDAPAEQLWRLGLASQANVGPGEVVV